MPTQQNTDDPTKPDYVRPEVVAASDDLDIIEHLQGGPAEMWAQSGTYIRQWADEDTAVYDIRRLSEPCSGLFTRTLSASVGKLFGKPPKIEYPVREDELRAHWDNIDAAGTKGDIAAKEFASKNIAKGYGLILVDHTVPPEGVTVTRQNEGELGLRPIWAFYDRRAVCSWRTSVINNVTVLTKLVLKEEIEEESGAFGVANVCFYRELYVEKGKRGAHVAGWRLWRAPVDAGQEFTLEREGIFKNRKGKTRGTIPIAIGYGGRRDGVLVAPPPLRDVAYANLAHWQVATELAFGTAVAAIEQPLVKGGIMPDENGLKKVRIGWLKLVNVEADGDFEFRGPSGEGLNQLKDRKVEKEQEIAAMGLSFMSRDTRAAETAEAKRLDAAAEDSTLATCGQGNEDALNQAWVYHCWYMGIDAAQAPTVTLNRDFESTALSPQHAQAIAALVESGMPVKQAVRTLIVGGFLKADEDEIDEIADEWETGQIDKQEREAEAASDRAAGMKQPARKAA